MRARVYTYSYTITYTPSEDRILPCPAALFVKIKNTAALPLRAAYLHGPYTLHTSSYPASFDPNAKLENPGRVGVPQFEPHVKAGGSWVGRLAVPEDIRTTFGAAKTRSNHDSSLPSSSSSSPPSVNSVTWIVEVASQILFSQSASVSYELLVSRDEKSLDFGLVQAMTSPVAAESRSVIHNAKPVGIYSEAIHLVVEDTLALWNKPALSDFYQRARDNRASKSDSQDSQKRRHIVKRRKNVHLVMLTHGLHSNVGADMLFLKESIDAAAKQAKEDRRKRKSRQATNNEPGAGNGVGEREEGLEGEEVLPPTDTDTARNIIRDEEEDEEIIVRGFHENAVRTEKGIQYLGKRLAKHILQMTYPDQPFLPVQKSVAKKLSNRLTNGRAAPGDHMKTTKITTSSSSSSSSGGGGTKVTSQAENVEKSRKKTERLAYKFTSISFIGHSLGGLIQTYAVAYIQKHSPAFFDLIKPINFIALASPMLGLSNENPVYVKFALDFGLVGRTGQDLGLFWRPPTFARTGWGAMVGNFGGNKQQKRSQQQGQQDPRAKPLLRILPTGPAHQVLKRFRNRTLYCNAVNDGIVPLRTSCLLFLDWRGLERVEKARRDNGLIGTVAGWGWNEITGFNSATRVSRNHSSANSVSGEASQKDGTEVPQPPEGVTSLEGESEATAMGHSQDLYPSGKEASKAWTGSAALNNPIYTIWNLLRPTAKTTEKDYRMYRRSQTMAMNSEVSMPSSRQSEEPEVAGINGVDSKRPLVTKGDSYTFESKGINAPPKTTVFESARDLLSPSIPSTSWLVDPSQRARTIFHDRVYHPDDIPPPPPMHKKPTLNFHNLTSNNETSEAAAATGPGTTEYNNSNISNDNNNHSPVNTGSIKVEEKIARAYHRDMAWRKVLVRLEPDAHNNIIVRRMFSNAYGWPVVKHLCDTHFADTYAAATSDEQESAIDRVNIHNDSRGLNGEEVKGQSSMQAPERSLSESREATDELKPLGGIGRSLSRSVRLNRVDSTVWDDADFEETSEDDDDNDFLERRSVLLSWSSEDYSQSDNTPQISDQIVQSPSTMMSAGILENGQINKTEENSQGQSVGQKEDPNMEENTTTPNIQPQADTAGVGPNRTFTDILGPSSKSEGVLDSQSEGDTRDDAPLSNATSSRLN